jgi:hypothetical protein
VSARVQLIVEVDGSELSVENRNGLSGYAPGVSLHQMVNLLEDAIGKVARAHGLDYQFYAEPASRNAGGGE